MNPKATVALVRAMAEKLANEAEAQRRELPTLSVSPFENDLMIDYATAAQMIATAMHHLDESLPGGQRKRTEVAMMLATIGLKALGVWLEAKGCEVSPLLIAADLAKQDPSTFRFYMTNAEGKQVVMGSWGCSDPNETHRIMTAALELTSATKRGEKITDWEFSRLVRGENVPSELTFKEPAPVAPKLAALLKGDPPNDGVCGFLKGQDIGLSPWPLGPVGDYTLVEKPSLDPSGQHQHPPFAPRTDEGTDEGSAK